MNRFLEATKAELERQVAARNKTIEEKDVELKSLYSKMPPNPVAGATAKAKPELELHSLIAQLDGEIEKKKVELSRNAGISVTDFNGRKESPKSDAYIRIEGELQALNEQRNLARQKLIDTVAK